MFVVVGIEEENVYVGFGEGGGGWGGGGMKWGGWEGGGWVKFVLFGVVVFLLIFFFCGIVSSG